MNDDDEAKKQKGRRKQKFSFILISKTYFISISMLTNWVNLSIIFDLFWHYSEWIRLPCLCDIYTNDRGLPQNYVTTTYSRWGNKKLCSFFKGRSKRKSNKRWKTFSSPPQAFICPCFWYLNELMSKDIFLFFLLYRSFFYLFFCRPGVMLKCSKMNRVRWNVFDLA